jgi:hypothetical protein
MYCTTAACRQPGSQAVPGIPAIKLSRLDLEPADTHITDITVSLHRRITDPVRRGSDIFQASPLGRSPRARSSSPRRDQLGDINKKTTVTHRKSLKVGFLPSDWTHESTCGTWRHTRLKRYNIRICESSRPLPAWHVTMVTLRVNPQGRRRRCTNVNSNSHPGD